MGTPVRFGAKLLGFSKIYGVSAQTGGGGWVSANKTKRRGQFFAILCGRFLWTSLTCYVIIRFYSSHFIKMQQFQQSRMKVCWT